jgi:hypothetical protein
MRTFQNLILTALTLFLSACGGDRRIDFDSAVRSTADGEFSLIVVTDKFVSFQKDAFHKYQYYFAPPLPVTALDQIKTSAERARANHHEVHVEDIRDSTNNQPST